MWPFIPTFLHIWTILHRNYALGIQCIKQIFVYIPLNAHSQLFKKMKRRRLGWTHSDVRPGVITCHLTLSARAGKMLRAYGQSTSPQGRPSVPGKRAPSSLKRSLCRFVSDPRRNTLPHRNSWPINWKQNMMLLNMN